MIATFVYKRYLTSSGAAKKLWFLVRSALIRLSGDPVCVMPVHGLKLMFPLSHPLPDYLDRYRFYDSLPHRLGEYIRRTQGYLTCIDVGANVGDSIAAFYQQEVDSFLAIEPNPKFSKLLTANWGGNKNVIVVADLCSSRDVIERFEILEKNGSASIFSSEHGVQLRSRTLDDIVNGTPFDTKANVLKIDTDGHDLEVLAGARKVIAHNRPAILFECGAFGNSRYVADCLTALEDLKANGYNGFLVYDNYGYLMGLHSLTDLHAFRDLLFYQVAGGCCYFDLLVMKEDDLVSFYASEKDFFARDFSR